MHKVEMALFLLLNQSLTDASIKVSLFRKIFHIVFENENIDGATEYLKLNKPMFYLSLSIRYELTVCILINYYADFNIFALASYSYLKRKDLKSQ